MWTTDALTTDSGKWFRRRPQGLELVWKLYTTPTGRDKKLTYGDGGGMHP